MASSGSFARLKMCSGVISDDSRRTGADTLGSDPDRYAENATHPADSTDGTDLSDDADRDSSSCSTGNDERSMSPRNLCATCLSPFNFKASGHHLMFRTDDGKIAKESTHEEERFYTSPDVKIFKSFIAKFAGTATATVSDIQLVQSREGRGIAVPQPGPSDEHYDGDSESKPYEGRVARSSSTSSTPPCISSVDSAGLEACLARPEEEDAQHIVCTDSHKISTPSASPPTEEAVSPPVSASSAEKSQSYAHKMFILLRDVTHNYERPCVLDIKMGIRNYGLNASISKRRNKIKKTWSTTSSTLGFRMHGMRMWDPATSTECVLDKLRGRELRTDTVQPFLSKFFCTNGLSANKELVGHLLAKLTRLLEIFEKQEAFHFYTSSLLLYYDQQNPAASSGVCMIDFAFTYPVQTIIQSEQLDSPRDEGYIFGLKNLIALLQSIRDGTHFVSIPQYASLSSLLHPPGIDKP